MLARIPAPLFAGFVALSLVSGERSPASPIVLAGGLVGYAVASALGYL
jgi:hypothetical protein